MTIIHKHNFRILFHIMDKTISSLLNKSRTIGAKIKIQIKKYRIAFFVFSYLSINSVTEKLKLLVLYYRNKTPIVDHHQTVSMHQTRYNHKKHRINHIKMLVFINQ